MTLRLRLAFGLTAIALIFALPVFLAVRALDRMRDETARVRDREFAATLLDRKSTRLNSSHESTSRMPSSA